MISSDGKKLKTKFAVDIGDARSSDSIGSGDRKRAFSDSDVEIECKNIIEETFQYEIVVC